MYPSLIFSHGDVPETPPEKNFIAEDSFDNNFSNDISSDNDDYEEEEFY